jgi:hypothetical protein
MFRPKKKTLSVNKIISKSNANSDIKIINSQVNKKLKLVKS